MNVFLYKYQSSAVTQIQLIIWSFNDWNSETFTPEETFTQVVTKFHEWY